MYFTLCIPGKCHQCIQLTPYVPFFPGNEVAPGTPPMPNTSAQHHRNHHQQEIQQHQQPATNSNNQHQPAANSNNQQQATGRGQLTRTP